MKNLNFKLLLGFALSLLVIPMVAASYQENYHWYDNCQLNNAGGAISAGDAVTSHGYDLISGTGTNYETHGAEQIFNLSAGATEVNYNISEGLLGDNTSINMVYDLRRIFNVANFRFHIQFYNVSWVPSPIFSLTFVQSGGLNKIIINADTAPCSDVDTGARYAENESSDIQVYLNEGNLSLFINGTFINSCQATAGQRENPHSVRFSVTEGELYVRNITIFNGSSTPPPATPVTEQPPVVTITYPGEGDRLSNSSDWPIKINGTVTVQNGVVNYTWINDTRFTNEGDNASFNFTPNVHLNDGTYGVMVLANNSLDEVRNTTVSFIIDTQGPSIITSLDGNHSLHYAHTNVTFQLNITDNNLISSFNISTIEGYLLSRDNVNVSSYIFNASFNASTYGIGRHNVSIEYCDSHTALSISNYNYSKDATKKEIKYNFGSDYVAIRPQDSSLISDVSTTKLFDRYSLTFTKNQLNLNNQQKFIVESTYPIEIIGNQKGYYGWLIIPKLEKWVDFNVLDQEKMSYQITRVTANQVLVTIDGMTADTFTFESVGDLNCVKTDFQYFLYNYTAVYSTTSVESTLETFTFNIDFKDILVDGNGTLNYQSLDYNTSLNYTSSTQLNFSVNITIPEVAGNQTDVTFYWDFILNETYHTSIDYLQTVSKIGIQPCGDLTQVITLNISIFDEEIPTDYLLNDVDAVFTTWTNDSSKTINFTFDLNDQASYALCIYPNTSVTTNAYFLYNSSGGYTQRWFLTNAKLDTNISYLNLYNFKSTTGVSSLRGTLRSTDYQYFPLVTTKLQRYYLTENVWRTVQMDKSDDFGQILFHIKEESTDYRLIFEKSGTEIDRTNPLKFICTSSVCTLIFIVEDVGVVTESQLTFSDGYDNNTETFQLNWSDGTGLTHSVRLVLTQERGTTSTVICDTTVSSSSGTINCDTFGFNGVLLARIYKSQSDEVPFYAKFIEKIVDAFYEAAYIGTDEATWWSLGFSSTFVMGGAVVGGPIGSLVAYLFSLVFLSMFKLLSFATFGVMSMVVVLVMVIAYLLNR